MVPSKESIWSFCLIKSTENNKLVYRPWKILKTVEPGILIFAQSFLKWKDGSGSKLEKRIFFKCYHTVHTVHSFQHIHAVGTFICRHSLRFLSISLIADQLSRKNLPGVPSRVSSPGLPYSKPTHYQLRRKEKAYPLSAHVQAAQVSHRQVEVIQWALETVLVQHWTQHK